ncbi:hypothetical protein [Rhodococcus sp. WB9]|uniref:hypothetical protein n=1 Tax=Rhodococcus sp. WB9 TaxID=2594007 RepID=UPI0021B1B5DD|nr:hypothetical protein [Rhodococcus sp. WB9]
MPRLELPEHGEMRAEVPQIVRGRGDECIRVVADVAREREEQRLLAVEMVVERARGLAASVVMSVMVAFRYPLRSKTT